MIAGRSISASWAIVLTVALLAGCAPGVSTSGVTAPPATAVPTTTGPTAIPAVASPTAVASDQLTHIKIGFTSKSTGGLNLYVAQNLGIFQKYGLDAEFVIATPQALAAALVQGELDFVGTIPVSIQAAEQGLPIRGIIVSKDHPEYLLVGDVGVTDVEQLRGKSVAGGPNTQLPAQMLTQLLTLDGLQPGDYSIASVENDSARAALLANHQVSAAIIGLAQALPLLGKGYPLIDSTLAKIYIPSNGLAASLSTLQQRRDLAQRAVNAVLEATQIAAHDKPRTMSVLTSEFGLSEPDASKLFDLMQPTYSNGGRPAAQSIHNQLTLDAQAMQLAHPATMDDVYDFSLLPPG
jgi:ABC-type nitrate/sulfonate/bicarbonate transport system substrate-binding protein